MDIPTISVEDAQSLLATQAAVFLDVRDPISYKAAHIPGAQAINDYNITDFIEQSDKNRTYVVYCYHGNSSLGGTDYLLENGFADVKSMDGGFTRWQALFPALVE